jgi:hypothetical protein
LDTWTGPWQRALPTGVPGRWQGQVAHPFPGTPILYAFAVDGQEATSVNTGQGSSPVIGSITAYLFQVQPGTTHISITGHTPEPSYVGQPVEVSFALSVEPPAGGTPTGVVTVTDGAASCTATLPANSCSLTLSTAGSHALVATYSGNNSFLPSTSPAVPHSVQPGATGLAIVGHQPEPSYEGQSVLVSVALTVTPPASGTPTGIVTVTSGAASCTATLPDSGCSLILTSVGIHTLVASYSGDSNFLSSISPGVNHKVVEKRSVYLPLICR